MRFLKTNTAVRITVGPFFDKTDGVTPEVALTVTSEKLTLMVDTADVPTLVLDTAPTASGGANDMVHVTGDDAGFYDLELAAANVNYVGRAMLALTDAVNHCPVFHEFMILPAKVYDSLVSGTDNLETDTVQWLGTACATPTINGVPEVDLTHVAGATTNVAALATNVDAILTDTAEIGIAGAGLTNINLPDQTMNITGDITGSLSGSIGSVTGAVGSVTGNVGGNIVGSVGSLVANAIDNSSLHSNACAKISDSGIQRGASNWENNSDPRSLGWAISKLVNKVDINGAGNTLSIRKSDDSTALFTQAITTSGGAAQVVALDTA